MLSIFRQISAISVCVLTSTGAAPRQRRLSPDQCPALSFCSACLQQLHLQFELARHGDHSDQRLDHVDVAALERAVGDTHRRVGRRGFALGESEQAVGALGQSAPSAD